MIIRERTIIATGRVVGCALPREASLVCQARVPYSTAPHALARRLLRLVQAQGGSNVTLTHTSSSQEHAAPCHNLAIISRSMIPT